MLNLNVAQQTTNSQRTTIGADLGSSIGLGNERKLDVAVRLGWQHEFADTGRSITTNIVAPTQIYLRYDGGIGGGTDNRALNVGLRMSW